MPRIPGGTAAAPVARLAAKAASAPPPAPSPVFPSEPESVSIPKRPGFEPNACHDSADEWNLAFHRGQEKAYREGREVRVYANTNPRRVKNLYYLVSGTCKPPEDAEEIAALKPQIEHG